MPGSMRVLRDGSLPLHTCALSRLAGCCTRVFCHGSLAAAHMCSVTAHWLLHACALSRLAGHNLGMGRWAQGLSHERRVQSWPGGAR